MGTIRITLHRIAHIISTPVRLFRQRTMVQLMVSHVAVVMLTFVLLNAIAVAVILGWLPGRTLIGLEPNTQDPLLAERVRGYAAWLDLDSIEREHGDLDSPGARREMEHQLRMMLDNTVPGFARTQPPSASTGFVGFGSPQDAVITSTDGTVLASTDSELAEVSEALDTISNTAVHDSVLSIVNQYETVPDPASVSYTSQLAGDFNGAAAPIFNQQGGMVAILAFKGYPLTMMFQQARSDIIRETSLAVLQATWAYTIPAIIVAVPFAYWQSRSTSRRLERLANLADAFADGDLHTRVRVSRRDEIGRLGERFNELGMRIEDETQARRAFLSNVSHELRTPVAIIQGTVERIQDKKSESQRQMEQAISLIEMETRNLTRLIDDLSTLGRLEEARLRLELQPLDPYAIAEEAVSGLHQMAWMQRKVSIENLIPPDLPAAFGDPGRLRQIIHNLLFNALRHTPEGGLIVVQGAVAGDMMELSVSDTGVGIPPEKLERIFTRYYQAEIPQRLREGSGLGLHIVQQLVEAQGGSISVESEVGKGTTLRFTVPLSTREARRGSERKRDTGII